MIVRILFLLTLAHTTCAAMHPLDKKLIGVVKHKKLYEAKALLNQGANPNQRNALLERNALHYAVRSRNPNLTYLLLQHRANPNQKDIQSYTPVHEAALRGTANNIKALVTYGGDIEAKATNSEWTPLLLASLRGRSENVRELCKQGAMVNATDTEGYAAIHYAVQGKHNSIIAILHHYGANINVKNNNQNTPLHLAIYLGDKDTVEQLLALGANPTIRNGNNQLPHEIALEKNLVSIAKTITQTMHQQALSNFSCNNQQDQHEDELRCPICLDRLLCDQDVPLSLACGHVFHSACIFQWHEDSYNDCPVCRHQENNEIKNGEESSEPDDDDSI